MGKGYESFTDIKWPINQCKVAEPCQSQRKFNFKLKFRNKKN